MESCSTQELTTELVNRILVPFDISQYSLDASNEAIELAKSFGIRITFIQNGSYQEIQV
jgi:nucleotide-binding universal stress UspA family protein